MRAIRKDLLIHKVTYLDPVKKNEWNEFEYNEIELECVRVESREGYVRDANGDKLTFGNLMFWDNKHSTKCEFKPQGKIIFDGLTMDIVSINKLYGKKHLHHIEVALR